MGFFDRVKYFGLPITDEQMRKVFPQDDLKVVAIREVLVFNTIFPSGYLVLLASGEGGLFHLINGKLSVYAERGLHYRWSKNWGLVENPTKSSAYMGLCKRDPKTKKLVFEWLDQQVYEMDDAWSFWDFKFWENTNSPNGATVHSVTVAINGRGINLDTLLKRIPI